VASGSVPPGAPSDFYATVASVATKRGAKFALDTSGAPLTAALGYGIDLLKPSLTELEAIVGQEVRDVPSQMDQAKRLVRSGAARSVALTLGAGGAILATAVHATYLPAIDVAERTGVGAGDSFFAGLVFGFTEGKTSGSAGGG
jgi:6-phosphofructokinase 2